VSEALTAQLTEIRDAHGGELKPEYVLDAARDPSHPLHSRFEWDDSVAAEKFRLEQAHTLIQKAKVAYQAPGEDGPPRLTRAFVAMRAAEGHVYDPVEEVAQDPLRRKMALADMEREWKVLRRRWEEYAEFFDMIRRDTGEAA
jgi:hypothetical protein